MMRRKLIPLYIVAAVLSLSAPEAFSKTVPGEGAFLRQLQKRDSVLIADQLMYGFDLHEVPEGTVLGYPDLSKQMPEDVVVVSPWICDTLSVRKIKASNSRLYSLRQGLVIAPFKEGGHTLPPLSVTIQRPGQEEVDTLVFEPLEMDVRTMPVDTATFVPHDIKGQIRYPLTKKEILSALMIFWGVILLTALAVSLYLTYRRRKSGEGAPSEPVHIRALRKIDTYRSTKYWEPPRQKAFYSGVTDALREYIAERFSVGAMEMTTAEIMASLQGEEDIPEGKLDELKDLFERADFVKFAKMTASSEENSRVIPTAVGFVTSTYRTTVEETQQEEG